VFVNHAAYEATPNYGGVVTGCQRCNMSVKTDAQRRTDALLSLEASAARLAEVAARAES
jgi:hypothetical protein